MRIASLLVLAVLAAYVPLWWYLVFSGYYDAKMPPVALLGAKTFLPADLTLTLILCIAVHGLRRNKAHGYVAGAMVSGALVYVSVHGIVALCVGALPNEPAMHAILWPYLFAGIAGAALLQRRVKSVLAETRATTNTAPGPTAGPR